MELLALDITAVIISAIGAVVSLGTVAMTLIIKQRVESVHKDINGKMAQLLDVSGKVEKQIGKDEGIAQQKAESKTTAEDVVSAIKADKDIDVIKKGAESDPVIDVKIVGQDKSVIVKTEPKDKK